MSDCPKDVAKARAWQLARLLRRSKRASDACWMLSSALYEARRLFAAPDAPLVDERDGLEKLIGDVLTRWRDAVSENSDATTTPVELSRLVTLGVELAPRPKRRKTR